MGKLLSLIFVFISLEIGAQPLLQIYGLKVNDAKQPEGINPKHLFFSWKLLAQQRNTIQTSYHIFVADDLKLLEANKANIWDSGEQLSSSSIQIKYLGKPLETVKSYYWKVQIKDNHGNIAWSKASSFYTGLHQTQDWKGAKWIAYERLADSLIDVLPLDNKKDKHVGSNVLPLFRRDFKVKKPLASAKLYISGLGHFEARINGEKQGDHFLDAGWVKYQDEALYVAFDVSKALKNGKNTLGVMLGNGFYYVPPVRGRFRKLKTAFGFPKMMCRLVLKYQDGTEENIISDEKWQTSASPITFSSIYGGEDYDARLEQKGWDSPQFKVNKSWKNALLVDGPKKVKPQLAEPLRVFENFDAKLLHQLNDKEWVYDLGQNASGIISIKVQGKRGDTIRIYPSELLKDSKVNQKPTGSPFYFEYVLKGDGVEEWQPRFTYYGFRYLQVKGAAPQATTTSLPQIIALKGLHVRNSASQAGSFSSSNTLFNQTHTLIDWAIKSNMMSVFTDCPHREKLGWLEQSHLMISSVMYKYDVATLASKVVDDIISAQLPNGLIPEIAPEYVQFTWGGDMFRDSPEWGSTGIILPWYLYKWYGDTQAMEKAYPTMQRYIHYLQSKADGHILKQGLGDWYDIGPNRPGLSQQTPKGVTGTAIYYYDLSILQQIAILLGKPDDAKYYQELAKEVKAAFNKTFFNKETKQYATGSQAANAMALYMNLVEEPDKAAVLQNLIQDIQNRNYALTAGDIGYRYVLRVLEEAGRSDVIFNMNSRSDVPGYGYQLAKGATALTESWQALPDVSNNHFMLGHLMEWFYSGLAGIQQSNSSVAFQQIKIHPVVVGNVTSAEASYESPYGRIKSSWKKNPQNFQLQVEIPVNTTALIYLPKGKNNKIDEGGKAISTLPEMINQGVEGDHVVLKVGSGNYQFTIE
ncbi:family 78 glycoside hydrolase catalytic domain [Pedobacter glucosidilyticus]|uniref:family 78 glycoside hydrolase catalytic domain n=1 Tax=Pedobacter glucosidilyticus TaxID=1122941 RepID=UPI0026F1274D|nr:family 78 glycoside hydrolase catalytic domain [Pedobacter glucosidilyticus]